MIRFFIDGQLAYQPLLWITLTMSYSDLRILLSWESPPRYVPPAIFSRNQVVVCTITEEEVVFVNDIAFPDMVARTPVGSYDLFEVLSTCERAPSLEFDLVIVHTSSYLFNTPYNTKVFGCPTVLRLGDTHHGKHPIGNLITYALMEDFDFVVSPINRQHLHWFISAGIKNVAWMPLVHLHPLQYHEWTQAKRRQVVFVGQRGFHPRRNIMIEATEESGLPYLIGNADRKTSAELYSSSLVSLNCSLNGDLNLRNLEILSAGGFLLTDKLSPQSGFDMLLKPGHNCDIYSSKEELIRKLDFYFTNPSEAEEIARKGYLDFKEKLHPRYRVAALLRWVVAGELPELYSPQLDHRCRKSLLFRDLLETRIEIYEQIQEIHRVRLDVKVLISRDCPWIIAIDLVDLPGVSVTIEDSTEKVRTFLEEAGVESQVNLTSDPESVNWNVLVVKRSNIDSFPHYTSQFWICLDEQDKIIYSDAAILMNVQEVKYSLSRKVLRIAFFESQLIEDMFNSVVAHDRYPIPDKLDDIDTIVDVGANIGLSAFLFRDRYPEARIYCFEPDPFKLHLLTINSMRLGRATSYPFGLHSEDMFKTIDSDMTYHGTLDVAFRKADDYLVSIGIQRIDLLRINAGGFEVEVLRGLGQYLDQVKVIYLDFLSEVDRQLIDQFLSVTHTLWKERTVNTDRGSLCYLQRRLVDQC